MDLRFKQKNGWKFITRIYVFILFWCMKEFFCHNQLGYCHPWSLTEGRVGLDSSNQ